MKVWKVRVWPIWVNLPHIFLKYWCWLQEWNFLIWKVNVSHNIFKGVFIFFFYIVLRSWALFGEEKLCITPLFHPAVQCKWLCNPQQWRMLLMDSFLLHVCMLQGKLRCPLNSLSLQSCLEKGTAQNSFQDQNFIL